MVKINNEGYVTYNKFTSNGSPYLWLMANAFFHFPLFEPWVLIMDLSLVSC